MTNLRALLSRPPLREADGVVSFVDDAQDYCDAFGVQWKLFRDVQIDAESGANESASRFFAETGWSEGGLAGKTLLDAGCGSGRFADVAVRCGARVVAVDLSRAAEACATTLAKYPHEQYLVARANLLDLPFAEASFDGIYSLGVLQHTPEPLETMAGLVRFLRPGGRLATWIYERHPVAPLQPRTWIRKLAMPLPTSAKLLLSKALVASMFPAGWSLSWFGRLGERAAMFLPYAARHHLGRGDLVRQWRYSVMDTFDWYGPRYDQPQAEADVVERMQAAGLVNVRRLAARGMAIVGERAQA